MRPPATVPEVSVAAVDSLPSSADAACVAQARTQVVQAVFNGEVDALLVSDAAGARVITLNGADRVYRLLVEDMAEGALTLTPDGVVAWCNRSFSRLMGKPQNRLIGTPIDLCFAHDGRLTLASFLRAAQQAKLSLDADLLNEQGLRVPVYLSLNSSVVDGLPEALCMTVTDLTQQKRGEADTLLRQHLLIVINAQQCTQQTLEESLASLGLHESALGAISQGVVITDADRKVTYVNAASEAMSGYSAAEMLGRTCGFLHGAHTSQDVVSIMRHAMDGARPFHGELLNYRKDGTPFWNDLSITPIFASMRR